MKPSTEEFLYFLLWSAKSVVHPTYLNYNDSFESWAYRNRLNRRLADLEQRKLLERRIDDQGDERNFRLTERGRQAARRGVDPVERWQRSWDGKWRLVFFDIPEKANRQRVQLRRILRASSFGYLQGSVWISPDPLADLQQRLKGTVSSVESLVLFEGRPCSGASDHAVVEGSWDFAEITRRYEMWSNVADRAPKLGRNRPQNAKLLLAWGRNELSAWRKILEVDPFLPKELWPKNYPGETVWRRRNTIWQTLREADQKK